MQALRGSVVDVVIWVGGAWRVATYSNTLTQEFVDRLNNSGFRVLNVDDGNLAILSGGSLRVRVEVLTDGYGSEQDAASVVSGAASAAGYNATGFTGTLVSAGGGTNSMQPGGASGQSYDPYDPNANKPPSLFAGLADLFAGGDASLLLIGVVVVLGVVVVSRR